MSSWFLQREFSNKSQHNALFNSKPFLERRQQDKNNEENHSIDATLQLEKN